MKIIYRVFVLAFIFCTACDNNAFTKGKAGMEYRIAEKGKGSTVQYGQWLEIDVQQYFNDSLLRDSRANGHTEWMHFDSTQLSADAFPIFKNCKAGDSIIFRVLADSAFKFGRPPFAEGKNGWLLTHIKIKNIKAAKPDMSDNNLSHE